MNKFEEFLREISSVCLGTDKISGEFCALLFSLGTISDIELNRKYDLEFEVDCSLRALKNLYRIDYFHKNGIELKRKEYCEDTIYYINEIIYKGAIEFVEIYNGNNSNIHTTFDKIETLLKKSTKGSDYKEQRNKQELLLYADILSNQLEEVKILLST